MGAALFVALVRDRVRGTKHCKQETIGELTRVTIVTYGKDELRVFAPELSIFDPELQAEVMAVPAELIWKIGGEQGEGIDGAGEIFAQTLNRLGWYVYGFRHFMSLIKGGHTHYKVRVTSEPAGHHGDGLDVLVALDQYSIDYNAHALAPGSLVIFDQDAFAARLPDGVQARLLGAPLGSIAAEVGGKIMKNTAALGASAAVIGLEPADFAPAITARFGGKKGGAVVAGNLAALAAGHRHVCTNYPDARLPLPPGRPGARRCFMSGNEAVALGALAAGCKVAAYYPITPATEIVYWLLGQLPKHGGIIVQGEDEIAAIHMALGASYAGARAMTSTSGPGFSLMMEALGLSSMAELPLVIVDVQRAGPSTGLPTKTEQSDLQQAVYGSHGDSPRIVLAPTSIEDCFYYTAEAFNLADRYQVPVIILSDLLLGMAKQSLDGLDYDRLSWDRGLLWDEKDLQTGGQDRFRRYAVTDSGISPRTIPGTPGGRWIALSNEHDDFVEIEDQATRRAQMDKRMRKLQSLDFAGAPWTYYTGDAAPDLLLVGWGSTRGTIAVAQQQLAAGGMKVAHLQLGGIWPLPQAALRARLEQARRVLVIENNAGGQFARLIRQELGFGDKLQSCLKYDGDPFLVSDIIEAAEEVPAHGHAG